MPIIIGRRNISNKREQNRGKKIRYQGRKKVKRNFERGRGDTAREIERTKQEEEEEEEEKSKIKRIRQMYRVHTQTHNELRWQTKIYLQFV